MAALEEPKFFRGDDRVAFGEFETELFDHKVIRYYPLMNKLEKQYEVAYISDEIFHRHDIPFFIMRPTE